MTGDKITKGSSELVINIKVKQFHNVIKITYMCLCCTSVINDTSSAKYSCASIQVRKTVTGVSVEAALFVISIERNSSCPFRVPLPILLSAYSVLFD